MSSNRDTTVLREPQTAQASWLERLVPWLAATDIDGLELRGPGVHLCLARRGGEVVAVPAGELPVVEGHAGRHGAAATERTTTVVTAASPGVFLHRHPLLDAPLVAPGAAVKAGQPVGLLRIGALLLPVLAPCDADGAEPVATEGTVAGYGTPLVHLATRKHARMGN